jgi:histidine ammonia-lyase
MNIIGLDGNSLTIEQVLAISEAEPGEMQVVLGDEAKVKINRAAQAVVQLLEEGQVAYGITTGFGAFKDRIIPLDKVEQLQRHIIISHAVGVGNPFDRVTTRAIMLIRANTLSSGYSGIRLSTLQLLLDMLNAGIHPVIPEKGSLGASGDLAPLAHMALVMIGEGEAEYNGEIIPGAQALSLAGLQPVILAAKEGLALTNGTSVMCALGTLGVNRAEQLSKTADVGGCLSLEALNGTTLAFDARIHNIRPFPRQLECAANLCNLLEGSDFTRADDPKNVQDAYTLRCMPQVHGAVRDAIAYTRWVFEIELNSVTDNPLIFIDDETDEVTVLSGGNFHGEPLALAMDYLAIALSDMGNMSERRIMRLVDESYHPGLLPAFLTHDGGLNSGFMIIQYTAAALATENKVLAHPASVDNITTSANVEDHVSMGCTAGLKVRQVIDNVGYILAIELMTAAQGIDFRKNEVEQRTRLGKGTQAAYDRIREDVPFLEQDAIMYPHMDTIRDLIFAGEFAV